MSRDPLFIVVAIACLAVLAVLAIGIASFARGGEFNKKYGNKLMQLRLLLQFIAIIVIVGFVYFSRHRG